jgi:hypothetical protein
VDQKSWFRPLVFVGATEGYADVWEDHIPGGGISGRFGLRLPSVDLSVVGEHWNDWDDIRFSSALVEANLYPFGTGRVAPFLLLGLGRYTYTWREGASDDRTRHSGGSGTLGVGIQSALWHGTALRTEAAMRVDGGGFKGQLRLGLGYAADAPAPGRVHSAPQRDLTLSWMAPVRGPWRFVQPGFGLNFSRPVSDRFSSTLGLEVDHWQIPGSGFNRDYIYDTRAFVGTPGVEWRPGASGRFSLRAGPAMALMGEGPDGGLNLGLHATAATSLQPLGLPLRVGAGWMWLPRDAVDDVWIHPGEDQQGLMVFGGLRL